MFCSNCGKTLKPDEASCPNCGAVVGESRFDGSPYTGTQARLKPGEAVLLKHSEYVNTAFMGTHPKNSADRNERTVYRTFSGDEAPLYGKHRSLFDQNAPRDEDVSEEPAAEDNASYDAPEENEEEMSAQPVQEENAAEDTSNDAEQDDAYYGENGVDDDDEEDEEEAERRLREERKAQKKAQREARKAERKAREEAEDEAELGHPIEEDENEEDELEELRARKVTYEKQGEINLDVSRYMNELRSTHVESEKKSTGFFSFMKKKNEDAAEEETDSYSEEDTDSAFSTDDLEVEEYRSEDTEAVEAETYDKDMSEAIEYNADEEAQYVSNDDDLNFSDDSIPTDDGYDGAGDDITESELSDAEALIRRQKYFTFVKYGVAALIVIGIIVGVTTLLSNIAHSTKKTQIPNVTQTLFEQGVALMQERVSDNYINGKLGMYNPNNTSTLLGVMDAITADRDSLQNLLPAEPDVNDQRFINAIMAIQEDINNCITNDILSLNDTSKNAQTKSTESNERWLTVRSKVDALAAATDKAQLDALQRGERIEVIQQTTPEPVATATPVPYTTLSKGSRGTAVIALQTRLTDLGYLDGVVDGNYGTNTKTAVQLFQKQAGLTADGIAGPETQMALYDENAPAYQK